MDGNLVLVYLYSLTGSTSSLSTSGVSSPSADESSLLSLLLLFQDKADDESRVTHNTLQVATPCPTDKLTGGNGYRHKFKALASSCIGSRPLPGVFE
jgi:hypothetical protein